MTEEPSGKSDSGTVKQRKMSKKNTEEEPKARALMSTNSDRCVPCLDIISKSEFNLKNRGKNKKKRREKIFNRTAADTKVAASLHPLSS